MPTNDGWGGIERRPRPSKAKNLAQGKAGSHRKYGPGTNGPVGAKCCSYQEAGRAIIRRKYRLAVRYVRLDIKARLGVI